MHTKVFFRGKLRVVKPSFVKISDEVEIKIINKCWVNCADDMYELINNLYVGSFIIIKTRR